MAKSYLGLRYAVVAVMAVTIAVSLIIAWRSVGPDLIRLPAPHRRINEVTAKVDTETLDESIEQLLIDNDAYFFRHTSRKFWQDDFETMLSNPRCGKVIEEIAELPEAERDDKCHEVFTLLFAEHTAAIRRVLTHRDNPNTPKNEQSMLASKLAVCTAIVATARHGTTRSLVSQFAALGAFRDEINRRLAASEHHSPNSSLVATNIRHYYVPDNRFQLNALCIHAARLGGARETKAIEICSALKESDSPIVNWPGKATWYDPCVAA